MQADLSPPGSTQLGRVPLGTAVRRQGVFVGQGRPLVPHDRNVDAHRPLFQRHAYRCEGGAGSMVFAAERIVVTMFIVVMPAPFIVVAQVRVVLQPMRNALRHMHPFMQVQYAERVQGDSEQKC